jgi:hypothetical protein
MLLHLCDGTIPILPEGLLVEEFIRKSLSSENLRMHTNYKHFLIVGTVEDAYLSPFR